jgi:hypothetical protein
VRLITRCRHAQQASLQWISAQDSDSNRTLPFSSVACIYQEMAGDILSFAQRWAGGLPQVYKNDPAPSHICELTTDPKAAHADALVQPGRWPVAPDVLLVEKLTSSPSCSDKSRTRKVQPEKHAAASSQRLSLMHSGHKPIGKAGPKRPRRLVGSEETQMVKQRRMLTGQKDTSLPIEE